MINTCTTIICNFIFATCIKILSVCSTTKSKSCTRNDAIQYIQVYKQSCCKYCNIDREDRASYTRHANVTLFIDNLLLISLLKVTVKGCKLYQC